MALADEVSFVKDVSIIVAGIVALSTFLSGVVEFIRQGRQHRAENLVQMRRRFLETPQYREILDMLQSGDPAIARASVQERRNFVGFLEEIALMVNSHLIRPEVAQYMFGYYVLLVARSDPFWAGLEREDVYWTLFNHFAGEMARMEKLPGRQNALRY
ncbi:MAG TPA: hypothetical protein VHE55_07115 [Fimbriimonadaceae bacterium]|nr:hypothetical protein [Fimbriimonadaceae bacterium]